MRILAVADLHYSLRQFDWLLQAAPAYDLVVIAGDLLDITSAVDLDTQVVVVLKYLRRMKAISEVLVCSGNHDLDAPNDLGEMHASWTEAVRRLGIATDGDSLKLGDTLVTCCAWWDGPESLKRIGAQLDGAAAHRSDGWIWLYHAPPTDSPVSWGGHRHFGDAALVGWIAQHRPDVVFSGHVHEAPFVRGGSWVDRIGDTWIFNAGRQIGEIPTTVALDTEAAEAVWFSLEGAETVALGRPLIRPVEQLRAMPAWLAPVR